MHNIAMALIADGQLKRAGVWLHRAIQEAPGDMQLRRLRRRLTAARVAAALKRA